MTDKTRDPNLIDDRGTNSAVQGNLAVIADAARSFRRVRGDESYDAKGLRTLWHQGKLRTELLTWENRKGYIVRQELSFFGYVVDFREGKALSTGHVKLEDAYTDTGAPKGNLVQADSKLDRTTLEYASQLLKNVPDRDYYAQHLLKQVNDALNAESDDDGHTVIADIGGFSKGYPEAEARTQVARGADIRLDPRRSRTRGRLLAFAILILVGLVLGVGIRLLLRRA